MSARKEASRRLGVALQTRYRGLVEASGEAEVQTAAIQLGDLFNTNIEFVINVLKHYGGMDVKFEPMTSSKPKASRPANALPEMPALLRVGTAGVAMPKRKPH